MKSIISMTRVKEGLFIGGVSIYKCNMRYEIDDLTLVC